MHIFLSTCHHLLFVRPLRCALCERGVGLDMHEYLVCWGTYVSVSETINTQVDAVWPDNVKSAHVYKR